eukprot:scaffold137233_cov136-Phaeocystis_antarctica.AAC.2
MAVVAGVLRRSPTVLGKSAATTLTSLGSGSGLELGVRTVGLGPPSLFRRRVATGCASTRRETGAPALDRAHQREAR